MSVDKSFEKLMDSRSTKEALDFAGKYSNKDGSYFSALIFYDAYTAGQKTLSPEAREVINDLLRIIEIAEKGYSTGYTSDISVKNKAKKLLEAVE